MLLVAILVYACGSQSSQPALLIPNAYLHVVALLERGDSLYDLRTGYTTIGESLVYFDSANHLALQMNDTFLMANTIYNMGNVYNAWNKEPQTTLYHYYLTRSRIDVYKYGRYNTPYLDSLDLALQGCKNRFDSACYYSNLLEPYAAIGNKSKAYNYRLLNLKLITSLDKSSIISTQQRELLKRQLQIRKEKERRDYVMLKNKNLYLLVMGFALLTTILFVFLYLFNRKRVDEQKEVERQQQFTNLLLENVEMERKRIATDLHDGINHELLGLKNNVYLNKAVSITDVEQIITSVREVSRNLYPALFEAVGLEASVGAMCARMEKIGFFTTCEIEYVPMLTMQQELQVYRIIQEALTNMAKHAEAEACKVTIKGTEKELWVEIKDNGKGFDNDKIERNENSFGLQSMLQRAKAVQAKLSIESSASGTKVTLIKSFK